MRSLRNFVFCALGLTLGCGSSSTTVDASADGPGHAGDAIAAPDASVDGVPAAAVHQVIIFVWDGLRPDSVSDKDTPTLAALGTEGVSFRPLFEVESAEAGTLPEEVFRLAPDLQAQVETAD